MCILSNYHNHLQIGSMTHLSLFRVGSWNNGLCSVSFNILIMPLWSHCDTFGTCSQRTTFIPLIVMRHWAFVCFIKIHNYMFSVNHRGDVTTTNQYFIRRRAEITVFFIQLQWVNPRYQSNKIQHWWQWLNNVGLTVLLLFPIPPSSQWCSRCIYFNTFMW